MPKDTKTLGNNKARACESLGFVHKKRLCQRFDTTSLYQLVLRLFMDVYFSNHTFTCSMLYSPVMIAVWSFMATNRTLS